MQGKETKKSSDNKWVYYSIILIAFSMIVLNVYNYIISYS